MLMGERFGLKVNGALERRYTSDSLTRPESRFDPYRLRKKTASLRRPSFVKGEAYHDRLPDLVRAIHDTLYALHTCYTPCVLSSSLPRPTSHVSPFACVKRAAVPKWFFRSLRM